MIERILQLFKKKKPRGAPTRFLVRTQMGDYWAVRYLNCPYGIEFLGPVEISPDGMIYDNVLSVALHDGTVIHDFETTVTSAAFDGELARRETAHLTFLEEQKRSLENVVKPHTNGDYQ